MIGTADYPIIRCGTRCLARAWHWSGTRRWSATRFPRVGCGWRSGARNERTTAGSLADLRRGRGERAWRGRCAATVARTASPSATIPA
ncbi:hypothetical protein HBB16_19550 [Pseudonocardia sp. MCCB 268]|nr:hypothetical protein [Pseudonocardia cytotoxica]